MSRPKLLFGHEYEVWVEDFEDGALPHWYRATYMSSHARAEGWWWEITDKRFKRDEVYILDWRLPQA